MCCAALTHGCLVGCVLKLFVCLHNQGNQVSDAEHALSCGHKVGHTCRLLNHARVRACMRARDVQPITVCRLPLRNSLPTKLKGKFLPLIKNILFSMGSQGSHYYACGRCLSAHVPYLSCTANATGMLFSSPPPHCVTDYWDTPH